LAQPRRRETAIPGNTGHGGGCLKTWRDCQKTHEDIGIRKRSWGNAVSNENIFRRLGRIAFSRISSKRLIGSYRGQPGGSAPAEGKRHDERKRLVKKGALSASRVRHWEHILLHSKKPRGLYQKRDGVFLGGPASSDLKKSAVPVEKGGSGHREKKR